MDKIELKSRYGDIHILSKISDDEYVLNPSDKNNYMSVIYTPEKLEIAAIDPEGGPYISIGDKIFGREIINIRHEKELGFVIKFK